MSKWELIGYPSPLKKEVDNGKRKYQDKVQSTQSPWAGHSKRKKG